MMEFKVLEDDLERTQFRSGIASRIGQHPDDSSGSIPPRQIRPRDMRSSTIGSGRTTPIGWQPRTIATIRKFSRLHTGGLCMCLASS